jgi:signal transduction histidine kinase/CHASE3 domain sensor protein
VVTSVTWALVVAAALAVVLVAHDRNGLLVQQAEMAETTNTQVNELMTSAETSLRGYLLTGERPFLGPYNQSTEPLERTLDQLDRMGARDASLAALVQNQRSAAQRWLTDYAEPAAGDRTVASATWQLASSAAFDSFRAANAALGEGLQTRAARAVQRQRDATALGLGVLFAVAVVGLLVVVRPTVETVRLVGRPLEDLGRTVDALKAGDLTARADTQHVFGEILSVAEALNSFATSTEQARARAAEEVRLSGVVVDLGRALTTTLDLDDVARVSVEVVSIHLSSTTWVCSFDLEGTRTRGQASSPIHVEQDQGPELAGLARRVTDLCWQRQTSVTVTRERPANPTVLTAEEGIAMLDYVAPTGMTALLCVPIGAGQEALGYLTLGRTADHPLWSDLETRAALQIGREVGRAVMLARLFERDQDLVGKIGALERRRTDFIAMASYAMRTPLAAILGHAELLRKAEIARMDPDLEDSVGAIERSAVRLGRLADDFVLLARLEEGKVSDVAEIVDLQGVCRAAIEEEADRAKAGDRSVLLTVHGRVSAIGVAAELRRAVVSLLSNALKFSPVGSLVKVLVYDDVDAGTAVIEVADAGLGISATDQHRLFAPYFRADEVIRRRIPGTGLGLRLAKLVVDKHDGAILVSADAQGTTFRIVLPRAEPQQRAPVIAIDRAGDVYADDSVIEHLVTGVESG